MRRNSKKATMKKKLKLSILEEEEEDPIEVEGEAKDALSTRQQLSVTTATNLDILPMNVQAEQWCTLC